MATPTAEEPSENQCGDHNEHHEDEPGRYDPLMNSIEHLIEFQWSQGGLVEAPMDHVQSEEHPHSKERPSSSLRIIWVGVNGHGYVWNSADRSSNHPRGSNALGARVLVNSNSFEIPPIINF